MNGKSGYLVYLINYRKQKMRASGVQVRKDTLLIPCSCLKSEKNGTNRVQSDDNRMPTPRLGPNAGYKDRIFSCLQKIEAF